MPSFTPHTRGAGFTKFMKVPPASASPSASASLSPSPGKSSTPTQHPHLDRIIPYQESKTDLQSPYQQHQSYTIPPQSGLGRQLGSMLVFSLVFGTVISLLVPRKTKVVIDHRNVTGPLTPEQLRASVPLHDNRMVHFNHIVGEKKL